jgi:hypothetical protein
MYSMMQIISLFLLVCAICVRTKAQTPPLLMAAGQQQFLTAPADCHSLNAYSSSDPLTVSVQQLNQSMYRLEAVKGGTAYITLNCNGHISTSLLTVQAAEYQTFVCPPELTSTYNVSADWKITQKQPRVFAFTRATLDANTLTCYYGAGDDVLLTRTLNGRCSLSPNHKGAYCQP